MTVLKTIGRGLLGIVGMFALFALAVGVPWGLAMLALTYGPIAGVPIGVGVTLGVAYLIGDALLPLPYGK